MRLRYAYLITCVDVVKDENGNVKELICTYDPETRGGSTPDGRKVKGTLHWVSAEHSVPAEVRLYDRLFTVENPLSSDSFIETINAESLEVLNRCRIEPSAADLAIGEPVQFERKGYFCKDPDSAEGSLVFNRTISLRDTWKKILKNQN